MTVSYLEYGDEETGNIFVPVFTDFNTSKNLINAKIASYFFNKNEQNRYEAIITLAANYGIFESPTIGLKSSASELNTINYPLCKIIVTSPFGLGDDPLNKGQKRFHHGVDLMAQSGTKVLAVEEGDVVESSFDPIYVGKYVVVKHINGGFSSYNHLSIPLFTKGQHINKCDVIGLSGGTGLMCKGPHLHFEYAHLTRSVCINKTKMIKCEDRIDPNPYFKDYCDNCSSYSLNINSNNSSGNIYIGYNGNNSHYSCSSTCSYEFNHNENITLSASIDGPYEFKEWTGDVSSTDNPISIIMDNDIVISANFVHRPAIIVTITSCYITGNQCCVSANVEYIRARKNSEWVVRDGDWGSDYPAFCENSAYTGGTFCFGFGQTTCGLFSKPTRVGVRASGFSDTGEYITGGAICAPQ